MEPRRKVAIELYANRMDNQPTKQEVTLIDRSPDRQLRRECSVFERQDECPAVLVEKVEGREAYRAVMGLRLRAVVENARPNAGHPDSAHGEQVDAFQALLTGGPSQTVDLRYVVSGTAARWGKDALRIGLLISHEGDSPEAARESGEIAWRTFQPWLGVASLHHDWEPISNMEVLGALVHPFSIEDLVELVVPTESPMELEFSFPVLPTVTGWSRFSQALQATDQPIMVSIVLRPVPCSPFGTQRSIGFRTTHPVQASPTGLDEVGYSVRKVEVRVFVGSSAPLSNASLCLIGGALMPSHQEGACGMPWDGDHGRKSGIQTGLTWVRPQHPRGGEGIVSHLQKRGGPLCGLSPRSQRLMGMPCVRDVSEATAMIPLPRAGDQTSGGLTFPTIFPVAGWGIQSEGVILGQQRYHGRTVPLVLPTQHRALHTFIVGATGSGKSTLIQQLAIQDMAQGRGVVVIDYHGDLCEELLGRVPASRMNDVVYFNPADRAYPMGLNLLAYERPAEQREEEREGIINLVLAYLERAYTKDTMGPIFFQAVRNGLLLAMSGEEPSCPATLLDFVKVFLEPGEIERRLPALRNPIARRYWSEIYERGRFNRLSDDGCTMLQYILSKFSPFVDLALTRNVLCQPEGLRLRPILDGQRILLCNLSKGRLGTLTATFLGLILVFKLEQAALARAEVASHQRKPVALYVDEVQNLQTEHFPSLLTEMRKYQVWLTLASQQLSQLAPTMQDAVLGNCGTLVAFRLGPPDAERLASFFPPSRPQLLMQQPNFSATVRSLVDDHPRTAGLITVPLRGPANSQQAAQIVAQSRRRHAKARSEVEAAVLRQWEQTTEG